MKVVLVDWSVFMFRAIFSWYKTRQIPPHYTAFSMLLACLRRVGLSEDDLVLLACDGSRSWRKDVDPAYKSSRKSFRESFDIDWDEQYDKFDLLLDNIKQSTPFHILAIPRLEADDIIACAVKYYKDKNCVIISSDRDFDQLTSLPNVKLFSDRKLNYKQIDNPYESLAEKVQLEPTDDLTQEVTTEEELETRESIVNLLALPEWVNVEVEDKLDKIEPKKEYNPDNILFNGIKKQFGSIFNSGLDYQKELENQRRKMGKKKKGKKQQKKGQQKKGK